MFNTNDLGYKLMSGQLRDKRKHSEQLNKYLAGLIDADGCIFLAYNHNYLTVRFTLVQSFSNDPDGSLIKAIKEYYNIGSINFRPHSNGKDSAIVDWCMGTKDFKILYNRIGKHLRVKGTHADNLLWLHDELKGFKLTDSNIKELKEYSTCSRKESSWLKRPKHLAWAWLAGYFDGDGHYRFRQRKKYLKSYGGECNTNELLVTASLSADDLHIGEKLKEDLKGLLYKHKAGHYVYKRSLGKNSLQFSIPFLKNMRKYSCLEKKYSIIDRMIKYLETTRRD